MTTDAPIPEGTDRAIPILPSHDLERTTAMLERIGFAAVGRYDGYRTFLRGPIELHYQADDEVDPFTTAASCFLRVHDVDGFYAEVVGAGFEVWPPDDPDRDVRTCWEQGRSIARISRLEDKPWGQREFALLDETNNLLRVGRPFA